jgi:hypothetical protein
MNDTNIETFNDEKQVLHRVKFVLLLVLQIPSILISIFIFIFFLTHRALIHIRQNQALLILFVINFIQVTCDLPMVIHFYQLGRISPATPGYCTWWTFLEYTLNAAGEMLMATISIQRHIFIFRPQLLNIRLYRYLLHHLPLLFCLVYPIILYLIIIVFYPCDGTQWDYNSNVCGLANCYLVYSKVLGTYDWAVDNGLPIIIIIVANVALFVRVIRQKRRRQQQVTWRKQRRMTLQLLSISCLYFVTWFPNLCIGVVQQLFIPTFLIEVQFDYIFDLTYFICLLLPWICLGLFPEFTNWIWKSVFYRDRAHNAVRPTTHLNL